MSVVYTVLAVLAFMVLTAGTAVFVSAEFSLTALERSTLSTVAMPGGTSGSGAVSGVRSCRSLNPHASTTPAPSTAPSTANSSACVEESTPVIVRTIAVRPVPVDHR